MQVSQFTLYALAKGNKPDYHLAMPPDKVVPGLLCPAPAFLSST